MAKEIFLILFFFSTQHEDASVNMFDHMMKVNNLLPSFAKYNLTEIDVIFVKELIAGTALDMTGAQVRTCVLNRGLLQYRVKVS